MGNQSAEKSHPLDQTGQAFLSLFSIYYAEICWLVSGIHFTAMYLSYREGHGALAPAHVRENKEPERK